LDEDDVDGSLCYGDEDWRDEDEDPWDAEDFRA
jgi:hypothetical protein